MSSPVRQTARDVLRCLLQSEPSKGDLILPWQIQLKNSCAGGRAQHGQRCWDRRSCRALGFPKGGGAFQHPRAARAPTAQTCPTHQVPEGHTLALCPSLDKLLCRCKTGVLRPFFESGKPGTNLQSPFPVPATRAGREGPALPQPGRALR